MGRLTRNIFAKEKTKKVKAEPNQLTFVSGKMGLT